MKATVGVFNTANGAEQAVRQLRPLLGREQVKLLLPRMHVDALETVPTTKDMTPVGSAIGGALGGAVGLGLGAALFLPGLGGLTAAGMAATALAGLTGAVIGGLAGAKADDAGFEGLPVDEFFLYEDALRRGRSVVIANVHDEDEGAIAKQVLLRNGAESLDPAHKDWRVGILASDELDYRPQEDGARIGRDMSSAAQ